MASKNNLTKQEKSVNNTVETNPKGAKTTEAVISNSNLIGDRLWLEHFANALHHTVFNDDETGNSLLMHGRLFRIIINISLFSLDITAKTW